MGLSTTIIAKLDHLADRHEELSALLADPEVVADRNRYAALSREYAEVEPVIDAYRVFRRKAGELGESESLQSDEDPAIRDLAREDMALLRTELEGIEARIGALLTTNATSSWRSVPAPAATRRRSSPATCSACTPGTRKKRAGRWGF